MNTHLQRRKRIKALRDDDVVTKKLRAVWDTDVELLRRLREPPKRGRGAPAQLGDFHKWIAAHFLWLRDNKVTYETALVTVGDVWEVSKTAIEKALKAHEPAARQLRAALEADPMPNILIMADAYKALARPPSFPRKTR
jgi:hypothetical protein